MSFKTQPYRAFLCKFGTRPIMQEYITWFIGVDFKPNLSLHNFHFGGCTILESVEDPSEEFKNPTISLIFM